MGFALAGALPVRGKSREALVAAATIGQSATVVFLVVLPAVSSQIALFLLAGVFGGLVNVHAMTLLQTAAPPELRGRVQSLSTTLAVAVMPVGMALAGVLFDLTGGNFWLVIGLPGALMLLVSCLALFSKAYRGFLSGTPAAAPTQTSAPAG